MGLDFRDRIARFAWLAYLLVTVLMYTLGGGIAQYLGARMQVSVYFLGQLWALGLALFAYFTYRHFDDRAAAEKLAVVYFRFIPWKQAMLTGALVAATITASATLVLIQQAALNQATWILMLLSVAGACLYTLPPARWATSGYGELLLSVLAGAFTPALGFLLQFGVYHRYLAMIAFPLSALHLAMWIALSLPVYASQRKYELKTLLMRMGWENGMSAHNLLVLSAFMLIAVSALFRFPAFAVYPALFVLPLAVFDVYIMLRIAAGERPNWNLLTVSSVFLFLLPAYIMALAFWTH